VESISSSEIALVAAIGVAFGYVCFVVVRFLIPRKQRADVVEQRDLVIQKAQQRKDQVIAEAKKRAEEKAVQMQEELEMNLEEERLALEATDADLGVQDQFVQHEEERIQKLEATYQNHQKKVNELKKQLDDVQTAVTQVKITLQENLARIVDCDRAGTQHMIIDSLVNERRLDSQKRIKDLVDDLESHSKKGAERVLSRIMSRYQPSFIWPKSTNHVEVLNPRLFETLQNNPQLITDLTALTEGVEITLSPATHDGLPAIIRLGGGYGIFKEAARLTLEELLPKGPGNWAKCDKTYLKHRRTLENQALKLGRQAISELGLFDIHEEIQKMIGALNWRTSYRQNQFYHSLEVAKLAGVLAGELGVDPRIAKRCGLLHDIGKGIDYRIEGSHAVISGDYADRFGEKRLICDTVMSHHNDLVLDTPMSYVLKSADTLSGARPGARINLEEGYQERLQAMEEAIKSFPGIQKVAIMNGGREVHIGVNHKKIREEELQGFAAAIARKIEEEVAFPGQIKVLVTRRFEASAVA
jgi:ribonuclease Y